MLKDDVDDDMNTVVRTSPYIPLKLAPGHCSQEVIFQPDYERHCYSSLFRVTF